MKTEQFEEILKPYIVKILEGLEKGIDYATQELPIILQQYILYESITSWLIILLGIIIFFGWIKLYKNERKKEWYIESIEEASEPAFFFNMLGQL